MGPFPSAADAVLAGLHAMKLYLDMDGVLANFDKAARGLMGMSNYKFDFKYGGRKFWEVINRTPDFFYDLEPMPDFELLREAVWKANPSVLTAAPKTNFAGVEAQKRAWLARHFPTIPASMVHVTHGGGKASYCRHNGDILVDDRAGEYQEAWTAKGGIFIHHESAWKTIDALKRIGFLK